MELCPTFQRWLDIATGSNPEPKIRALINQLWNTLNFLHKLNIYHFDIKIQNLLIDAQPSGDVLKLIDFGISKQHNRPETDTLSSAGYTSPEQYMKQPHTPLECEVWQLGVFMYVITHDTYPFGSTCTHNHSKACRRPTAPALAELH